VTPEHAKTPNAAKTQEDTDQSYIKTGTTGWTVDLQKLTAHESYTLNKNIAHTSNHIN
jgi:hypothetical protein